MFSCTANNIEQWLFFLDDNNEKRSENTKEIITFSQIGHFLVKCLKDFKDDRKTGNIFFNLNLNFSLNKQLKMTLHKDFSLNVIETCMSFSANKFYLSSNI